MSSSHSQQAYNQCATTASDIAHLLNSYSPIICATFLSSDRIYIDHAGEVRDPDFRLFAPANYSPK
jgi:hypothetical protein